MILNLIMVLEPQFREESAFIPSVFYSMVDKPIVGHNDLVVDKHDISAIADPYVPLRRSQRTRRSTIPSDYEVYL